MGIWKTDSGSWVVSSHQVWITGSYQSEKAARLAYKADPQILQDAWEAKRDADGIICDDFSEDEMRKIVRETRAKLCETRAKLCEGRE